jgi:hypothetical protein
LTIQERQAESADARVSGAKSAWIKAFSPDRDRGGLEIRGESKLARRLLDDLAAESSGRATASERAA